MEHSTLDKWLLQNVKGVYIDKPGSETFLNNFVSLADYLVNPSVNKKNFLIVNEMCENYIPHLENAPDWLKKLK